MRTITKKVKKISFRHYFRNAILRKLLKKVTMEAKEKGYPKLLCWPQTNQWIELSTQGLYEADILLPLFEEILKPKHAEFKQVFAVDIGANIGNHTCFFSSYFKKVIAIEPAKTASTLLRLNLLTNQIQNVDIHEVGLFDKVGTLPFFENTARNIGASKFLDPSISINNNEPIQNLPITTGDRLLESYNSPIALIKLDIEGHELKALIGLQATLTKHRPIVLFESHRAGGENGAIKIFEFLRENGYHFFYTIERRYLSQPRWFRQLAFIQGGADLFLVSLNEAEDRFFHSIIASHEPL